MTGRLLTSFAIVAAAASALVLCVCARAHAAPPDVFTCSMSPAQSAAFTRDQAHEVHVRLFGAGGAWLADEFVETGPQPALTEIAFLKIRVAGLLDPKTVTRVACSFEGEALPAIASGGAERTECARGPGINIEGGSDIVTDTLIVGRSWALLRGYATIEHFLGKAPNDFNGDPFRAKIDRASAQYFVVSGTDPQDVAILFVGLHSGSHQIDYGPVDFQNDEPDDSKHYCFTLLP
jgi:hypothetical protein